MDFVGLKAAAAREIALAFGVPPMLLGLPGDATYANYREANRALWRLTVLPMAERILRGLSDGLAAWWPGLALEVDVDQISALAEDRERLWRQVSAADFLSDEEKREMLGFERSRGRRDRPECIDAGPAGRAGGGAGGGHGDAARADRGGERGRGGTGAGRARAQGRACAARHGRSARIAARLARRQKVGAGARS